MFLPTRGRAIIWGQLVGACLSVGIGLLFRQRLAYLALLPVVAAPALYIEQLRRQRVRAIEAKIDGFILALANALKATPSIGNALAYTQPLLAVPLDAEVGLALKEMRLGNTVDQALLSMAGPGTQHPARRGAVRPADGRQSRRRPAKILDRTAARCAKWRGYRGGSFKDRRR